MVDPVIQQTTEKADPEPSHTKVVDPDDPLILHHSDTPGLTLVSELLDGHNYGDWSRAMLLSLSAKNKLGLIDGTIPAPPRTDPKFPMWKRCNDMVLSWLVHAIQPRLKRSVLFSGTAAVVWNDLKDLFSQADDTRMYQIRQEISETRQDHQLVSDYYTKLKTLWDELASYADPIVCTCAASKQIADREEKERVMQFLMGLSDSFSTVRGSILLMNPLPDTRKVHGLILQHERQMEAASRRENLSTPHAMQTSRPIQTTGPSNYRKPVVCPHCEGNHSIDRCWYIIGFPVGHKWHGKNVKPRKKKPEAHNVELQAAPETASPTFTEEEYKQIMAMLKNQNGNDRHFANATGRGYEEDDWPGQAF